MKGITPSKGMAVLIVTVVILAGIFVLWTKTDLYPRDKDTGKIENVIYPVYEKNKTGKLINTTSGALFLYNLREEQKIEIEQQGGEMFVGGFYEIKEDGIEKLTQAGCNMTEMEEGDICEVMATPCFGCPIHKIKIKKW